MNNKRQLVIEKIANATREDCQEMGYGIDDIFNAAKKLGYQVIRYPIGEDAFLGCALLKDTDRIVFSNSSLILSREIFTVAHEIGHQKLHLSQEILSVIKDDDFSERNEYEIEANYFAACFLMPRDKVDNFIRFELDDKDFNKWNGWDIAKIQTAFNVSYDMSLIRLRALDILNESHMNKLKLEKREKTISKLLNAINGNVDLCKPMEVRKIPQEYIDWVISNYNEKLIPLKSLEAALNYVGLTAEDIQSLSENEVEDEESFEDLIGRMD